MKVGVLAKISKVKTKETIEKLHRFLKELGYETVSFSTPLDVKDVDVVIVLGGDGAILHAAVPAAKNNVKIIGINYGNIGFLTEYEKDESEQVAKLLKSLERGECRIIKRSLLQIDIAGKPFYALNEVAFQRDYGITTPASTQILKLQMHTKSGEEVVSGDGVLFCTPTGSTAYSLSAGGAILTPEAPVFMMTPICAFSMRARPTVFCDSECFTVRSLKGKAIILLDGKMVTFLPENVDVTVKKAPFTADFPVKENSDFFLRVRNKLNS